MHFEKENQRRFVPSFRHHIPITRGGVHQSSRADGLWCLLRAGKMESCRGAEALMLGMLVVKGYCGSVKSSCEGLCECDGFVA